MPYLVIAPRADARAKKRSGTISLEELEKMLGAKTKKEKAAELAARPFFRSAKRFKCQLRLCMGVLISRCVGV